MTEYEKRVCLMRSSVRALYSESDKFESWPRVSCQTRDFPSLAQTSYVKNSTYYNKLFQGLDAVVHETRLCCMITCIVSSSVL